MKVLQTPPTRFGLLFKESANTACSIPIKESCIFSLPNTTCYRIKYRSLPTVRFDVYTFDPRHPEQPEVYATSFKHDSENKWSQTPRANPLAPSYQYRLPTLERLRLTKDLDTFYRQLHLQSPLPSPAVRHGKKLITSIWTFLKLPNSSRTRPYRQIFHTTGSKITPNNSFKDV